MARFLLLIRGSDDSRKEYTPEERQQLLGRYIAWVEKLRSEGRHQGADELKYGGCTVRSREGRPIVDGPYAETKEAIGGYFLIEAEDLNEAAEIAKDCPTLTHGGFVDIREIQEH